MTRYILSSLQPLKDEPSIKQSVSDGELDTIGTRRGLNNALAILVKSLSLNKLINNRMHRIAQY